MTIKIKKKVTHKSPLHEDIMIKLSEIAGAVATLNSKADAILSKLPALTDPPIPADAEAGIVQLSDKLTSIDSQIPSAPTPVV